MERVYQAIDPRYFHLILYPTEKCSFRCTYCYEDFSIGKMSPEVVSGVKQLIDERTIQVENFELSWFGGEPLLAKDIIFDIQNHVKSNGRNFQFAANITTNGYELDLENAQKLCDAGVTTYQISLDGSRDSHNSTRVGKGGFPTFDRIITNLISMKSLKNDFKVILRLHFHPNNIKSISELTELLIEEFSGDERFKVYFKSINNLGGSSAGEFIVFDYRKQQKVKESLESLIAQKNMLHDGGGAKYICYASRLNSFAIRANGNVNKCTVALGSDINNVGKITNEGKLDIDNKKIKHWVRGLESMSIESLQCPLHAK
jgi:uncharacterized protein